MGRLLLCAALLCLGIRARAADPQYVINMPAGMVSGDKAKVCVNIVGLTEAVAVDVSLEHDRRNTSIISEETSSPKYFQCGEFEVPRVSEAVPVAIFFTANGSNTDLRERKSVVLNSASYNCMYQMNRPIFKPKQKVQSRIVCLDAQLKPVNQKFTAIYLQAPSGTRVAQWLNPEMKNGIASMEFQLTDDAPLGSYTMIAERESGYPYRQWIRVEEYIPPRFSVQVDSPQTLSVTKKSADFTVTSLYTYGEPVAGSVTIRYCMQPQYYGRRQNCFKDQGNSCANMTGELDADGTYRGVIDLYSSSMSSGGRSFNMDVTVTEEGTGMQVTESHYTWISSQPASLNFEYDSMRQHYKRGLEYIVPTRLTNELGEPMANEEVEVQVNDGDSKKAMTDSDGRMEFAIDTSNMVDVNFTVTVSYKNPDQCYFSEWSQKDYPSIDRVVQRFYSPSGTFIQIKRPKEELSCGQNYNIDVSYIISEEGTGVNTFTAYYMVLSKSVIVSTGQKDVDLSSARNGIFSLDLLVSSDMAPTADLLVYILWQNEMVTDTMNLNIEKCFKNLVSMTFSQEKVTPGATVDVQLSADPNSYCGVRVVDSSLFLLNRYEQFSADGVFNSRRFYYYDYNVAGFDVEDPPPPCEDPDKIVTFKGRYYVQVSSASEGDSYDNVKSIGLLVGGNIRLQRPKVCDKNPPQSQIIPLKEGIAGFGGAVPKVASLEMDSASARRAEPTETYRTNFGDLFMWRLIPVNTEGQATLSEIIPDSITSWQGTAFCTSEETGFGMTKIPANVTTFTPFFIGLSLPYSVFRDEVMNVKGVVRNYLEHFVKVQAVMAESTEFDASLTAGQQDVCIPPNGQAVFNWEVVPKAIGDITFIVSAQTTFIGQSCDGPNDPSQSPRKDTVEQTSRVEPEGVPQTLTSSNLVLVQNNNVQLPISITPPDNVVPDSSTARVTAVADIFGLSSQNLEDLVKLPYGCAEQNLARFAAIPPILEYLEATEQLKPELLEKAKGFMAAGYQRQLGFISGGGYRLFPNSIEKANSMLTIETFMAIESIKKYTYVDEARQQQSIIWMENSQKLENGCFKAVGKPVTNQEGDIDLQTTAMMAIALVKANYSLGKTLLNSALECLKTASKSDQKISEEVLMLHAFILADLPEYAKPLQEKLMKKAIVEGDLMHWERENMPPMAKVPFFLPPFSSAEVWITSYMLRCLASNSNITPEDLTTISRVSIWLCRQLNSHGGFPSTRDTIVAIQALTAVARLLYVPNSQQTVTVRRGDGEVAAFNLNQDNRLIAQQQALPDAKGDYVIDVRGTGWCLLQITVQYHIPVPAENSAYSLAISTSSDSCLNGVAYRFALNCVLSYRGSHDESGMAIVKMRMISGYNPDHSSLYKLAEQKVISKYQISPRGEVILYLENVPKEPLNFVFHVLIDQRVSNVKSSSALVYSYYELSENGYASYQHPCAEPTKGSS